MQLDAISEACPDCLTFDWPLVRVSLYHTYILRPASMGGFCQLSHGGEDDAHLANSGPARKVYSNVPARCSIRMGK